MMIKVILIMGKGRSGSTMLDQLLGQIDGFFSAGEVHRVWEAALSDSRCSCGEDVKSCPIWRPVLLRALTYSHTGTSSDALRSAGGGTDEHLRSRIRTLLDGSAASYCTPSTLSDLARRRLVTGRHPGSEALSYALYRALGEVTGSEIIVSSSKSLREPLLWKSMPGVRPYIVHLVRDPRGVAHSWLRCKKVPFESSVYMQKRSAVDSALTWTAKNVAIASLVVKFVHRYVRVHYEDLTRAPGRALSTIVNLVGEQSRPLPSIDDDQIVLRQMHTVAGNPSRFGNGKLELREDDAWIEGLSPSRRRLVTALTLPGLLAYRYPVRKVRSGLGPHRRHSGAGEVGSCPNG